MTSSEIMDSGKFSGQKPNFSRTCSLLSRYLQEKGSFGDLTLGLSATFQPHGSSTMETNQSMEKIAHNSEQEIERAPMTIFYGGQVMVYNDFPANKAKEIMEMANDVATKTPLVVKNSVTNNSISTYHLANDLPLARKASLARFFEKRKDRLTAKAPYQRSDSSKGGESQTWLGLAAESPLRQC